MTYTDPDFGNYSKRVAQRNPKVNQQIPVEDKILPPDKQVEFFNLCKKSNPESIAKPLR
jgi:hypothetical protein